jgi:hypothetical protein
MSCVAVCCFVAYGSRVRLGTRAASDGAARGRLTARASGRHDAAGVNVGQVFNEPMSRVIHAYSGESSGSRGQFHDKSSKILGGFFPQTSRIVANGLLTQRATDSPLELTHNRAASATRPGGRILEWREKAATFSSGPGGSCCSHWLWQRKRRYAGHIGVRPGRDTVGVVY